MGRQWRAGGGWPMSHADVTCQGGPGYAPRLHL